MSKYLLLAGAVAITAACATSVASPRMAYAHQSYDAPRVACEIDVRETRNGLRLTAFASGEASGDYEFVVTKDGGAGSSDIVQSGEFGPGHDQLLGEAEFTLERGAEFNARLVLSDADGVLCSDERSS